MQQYGKLVETILQKYVVSAAEPKESERLADLNRLGDAEEQLVMLTRTMKERYGDTLMSFCESAPGRWRHAAGR